ncbi:MAG TPA: hypothetical protein VF041_10560 [Gemmatimonadaceae bacterium]
MRSPALPFRRPIPSARAIRWTTPVGSFAPPGTVEDLALFISQGALREVMRHLRSDPEQELLGFLLGELYECPETGRRYVIVNGVLRTGYAIPETEPVQIPEEEWLGVQLEVRRRRALLAGWYHSAPFVGTHPARLDVETHRARFTEPWQVGLVIATSGDAPAGGFYRPLLDGPDAGGVFIPFHELLDDDAFLDGGRKRTLIDWANYETDALVERDTSERRPYVPPARPANVPPPRAAAPSVSWGGGGSAGGSAGAAGGAGAPPGTGGAGGWGGGSGGGGDPAHPDAAGAAPFEQQALPVIIPEPQAWDQIPTDPPPLRRRMRLGMAAGVLVGALAAAGGVYYWNQRGIPELPGFGAGSASRERGVAAAPAAAGRPTDRPVGAPLAGSQPTAARPARGAPPASAGDSGHGGTMTLPESSTASTPGDVAASPDLGTTGDAGPIPPSDNPRVQRFDVLADSLDRSIRNFGDRAQDFSLDRLTCRGLAFGYRSTDDAFIALANTYREVRDALDDARAARYQSLVQRMEGVNVAFDRSGCPRP